MFEFRLSNSQVVELAAAIPPELKMDKSQSTVSLRTIAGPLLLRQRLRRGMQAFSVPIALWLCGGLRPMVNDLLLGGTFARCGYFVGSVAAWLVGAHRAGTCDYARKLRLLLTYDTWACTLLEDTAEY